MSLMIHNLKEKTMSEMHRYGIEEEGRAVPDKNGWLVDYDDHVDYVVEVALAERERCAGIIKRLLSKEHYSIEQYEIVAAQEEITNGVRPTTTRGCPGGYVKEATAPESKFKVGDIVEWDSFGYKRFAVCQVIFDSKRGEWRYATETSVYFWECNLTLYIPPTPVEIIPTLVEHEWVRGTYKTGTAFGPCSVYYNEIGAMFAGDNHLIHWNTGKISDELATLERCDAPEVK